jgi:hypothetical protein
MERGWALEVTCCGYRLGPERRDTPRERRESVLEGPYRADTVGIVRIGRTPKNSKPRVSGAFSVRNRPFRDRHHIGRSHSWAYSPLSSASRSGSVSQVTQPPSVQDYTSVCSLLVWLRWEGRHGKPVGLSEESARTRRVAQGKCRSRFDGGNRHTGDGLGRSQFYRTTRWGDRNSLKCHCRRSEALDLFIIGLPRRSHCVS